MKEAHGAPCFGHVGYLCTLKHTPREIYWPPLHDHVKDWVHNCYMCRRSKPKNTKSRGTPNTIQVMGTREC